MPTNKVEQRTYEEALAWLRDHGFDLIEAPGMTGRVFLKKYNCSAAIQKNADDQAKKLLTSEQASLWNEMMGTRFAGEIRMMPPMGFGPPPGFGPPGFPPKQ